VDWRDCRRGVGLLLSLFGSIFGKMDDNMIRDYGTIRCLPLILRTMIMDNGQ
jgi:hypothetical protein